MNNFKYENLNFDCLTQQEIAFLLEDNKQLVNKIARRYFLVGGTIDDLIQEGMIGLFSAITHFSAQQNCSFKTFATLCIERNIQDAVKSANRLKNLPLNEFMEVTEDGKVKIMQENNTPQFVVLPSSDNSPEEEYISKSQAQEILENIKQKLSKAEQKVFNLYIEGVSISEISSVLNTTPKSVYNSISRIKQKLSFLKSLF